MQGFSGVIHAGERINLTRTYGQYNPKFPADKVNHSDDAYDVMFDGVLLNAASLCSEYGVDSVASLLTILWEKHGLSMLSYLKGSYVMSIWDKVRDVAFVANDRLNKRPLYYHLTGNKLYYSSRYLDLVALLAENGLYLEYSPTAFSMLAAIGQLYERFTPLKMSIACVLMSTFFAGMEAWF